jgi:hypothetical protein
MHGDSVITFVFVAGQDIAGVASESPPETSIASGHSSAPEGSAHSNLLENQTAVLPSDFQGETIAEEESEVIYAPGEYGIKRLVKNFPPSADESTAETYLVEWKDSRQSPESLKEGEPGRLAIAKYWEAQKQKDEETRKKTEAAKKKTE